MGALAVKPKLASGPQTFPATTGAWVNSSLVADSLKKTPAANDDLASGPAFDEETGLYSFGARYYDPRTSVWQSPDSILGSYLNGKPNGGVFGPINLALYSYAGLNPLVLKDPDGKWSSVYIPGFSSPVHQMAVQRVLGNQLPPQTVTALAAQQMAADRNQAPEAQRTHAMTGQGRDRATEIKLGNQHVERQILAAQAAAKRGDQKAMAEHLGNAIHTVQDASSPTHRGFQTYEGNLLEHSGPERRYPAAGTREARELEGGTQYVYDIFRGAQKMPEKGFFNEQGTLNLPEGYGERPQQPAEKGGWWRLPNFAAPSVPQQQE